MLPILACRDHLGSPTLLVTGCIAVVRGWGKITVPSSIHPTCRSAQIRITLPATNKCIDGNCKALGTNYGGLDIAHLLMQHLITYMLKDIGVDTLHRYTTHEVGTREAVP